MYVFNPIPIKNAIKARGYSSVEAFCREHSFRRSTLYHYLGNKPVFPEQVERLLALLQLSPSEVIAEDRQLSVQDNIALISEIVDKLQSEYPNCAYVLFGSRARARCRRYSDFDVGIFKEDRIPKKTYFQLIDLKEQLEEDFPYFIDLVDLSSAKLNFLQEISKDMVFLTGSLVQWAALNRRIES